MLDLLSYTYKNVKNKPTFAVGNVIKVEIDISWMFNVTSHWLREFVGVDTENRLTNVNNKVVPHLPVGIDLVTGTGQFE